MVYVLSSYHLTISIIYFMYLQFIIYNSICNCLPTYVLYNYHFSQFIYQFFIYHLSTFLLTFVSSIISIILCIIYLLIFYWSSNYNNIITKSTRTAISLTLLVGTAMFCEVVRTHKHSSKYQIPTKKGA